MISDEIRLKRKLQNFKDLLSFMKYYYKLFVHFSQRMCANLCEGLTTPCCLSCTAQTFKMSILCFNDTTFSVLQPEKKNACSTIFNQGYESSDFNLISDFFALHKTPFSNFKCIEKHIFSGISDYFRLFQTFFSQTLSHPCLMQ